MSQNDQVFNNILNKLNELQPTLAQKMATTSKEYFVEQFNAQGGDYGTWPSKIDGETPTLKYTENLYDRLNECDLPGNYEIKGEGANTLITLKVEALSDKGFDYGAFQNTTQKRTFFEISYELNERIQEVVRLNLNQLND